MAKMKPEIPAGKFVILNRINKQGETTINLRFHMDGYVKRSTGIAIPPAAWDEKKCCVKASYPQAARINADLAAFKQDIDRKLLEYDGKITKNVLNFILNGGDLASTVIRTGASIARSASGELSVSVVSGYEFYLVKSERR